MAIVQLTRFRSEKTEDMIEAAKMAKKIFEGHGAEYLRLSRFYSGAFAGEWLVASRYANWEVYGKVQEKVMKDPAYGKLMTHMQKIAELTGRNVAVGIDL